MINREPTEIRKPRFSVRAKVVAVIVAMSAVLVSGIVLAVVLAADDEPKPPSIAERVIDMCQDAVLDILKAPATADFVGTPETESSGAKVMPVYTVLGEVDAENSFGAKIRSIYTCEVRTGKSDDTWNVESVDVV